MSRLHELTGAKALHPLPAEGKIEQRCVFKGRKGAGKLRPQRWGEMQRGGGKHPPLGDFCRLRRKIQHNAAAHREALVGVEHKRQVPVGTLFGAQQGRQARFVVKALRKPDKGAAFTGANLQLSRLRYSFNR